MNDSLENLINACRAARQNLANNDGKWNIYPIMVTSVGKVDVQINLINLYLPIEQMDNSGIAAMKDFYHDTTLAKCIIICELGEVYGNISGNLIVRDLMADTISRLDGLRGNAFYGAVKSILNAANTVAAALIPHGVSALMLTELDNANESFLLFIEEPRVGITIQENALQRIQMAANDCTKVYKDEIDHEMARFKLSEIDFYNTYFMARMIVDAGAGSPSQTLGNTTPANIDFIQNLAFTGINGARTFIMKCLSAGTNYQIYFSAVPGGGPVGAVFTMNDLISPQTKSAIELGWSPATPYLVAHFPGFPSGVEWEVKMS